jgi:hypothetical protein
MSDITVVTDALRDEARHWNGLAHPLDRLASDIGALHLGLAAFAVGSGPVDATAGGLQEAYERFRSDLTTSVLRGSTEFDQVAAALRRIADRYDNDDDVTALSLRDIYGG